MSAFDVVIAGGDVIDGSGGPSAIADVGVAAGRIVAIGDLAAASADRRIDATGRVVTPGFVDIHSHSDFTLLVDAEAESALAQGVTTEVVGNCGHGCAPLVDPVDERFTGNIYGWGPDVQDLAWRSIRGYLDALEAARPAINVATLVPFGNLRLTAVRDVTRPAHPREAVAMSRELELGLDAGAVGLSTGLEYPAEQAASGGELNVLAAIVARRGRLYATHTRDRGLRVVEGTREAIDTARTTGARTQIAHILARRGSGGVEANEKINEILEDAAADGLPIAWDVHTRLFGITNLSTALAPGSNDPASMRVDADDPGVIASFGRAGWDRTYLLEAGPRFTELATRSVSEFAAATGLAPREVLVEVLREAAAAGNLHRPMAIGMTYAEADIDTALRLPQCAVGSDATTMNLNGRLRSRMLPGAFTWASWYVQRMVRGGVLTLPEAIRRITSLPAAQAELGDRGRLRIGARADVAVFDPSRVAPPTDPVRPESLATGIDIVLVNGRIAVDAGRPTGVRAGEVLRA